MRALLLVLGLAGCVADATVVPIDDLPDTDFPDTDPPDTGDTGEPAVDGDGDGFDADEDCDDTDPEVNPGAEERCDLVDRDCDGEPIRPGLCPCEDTLVLTDDLLVAACPGPATWELALDDCEDAGLDLVSITDAAENAVVADLVEGLGRGAAWIGLTDRTVEDRFRWSDGTPTGFERWERGEPNDFGRGEDCAQIYPWNGRWNDASCVLRTPYVCGWRRP